MSEQTAKGRKSKESEENVSNDEANKLHEGQYDSRVDARMRITKLYDEKR